MQAQAQVQVQVQVQDEVAPQTAEACPDVNEVQWRRWVQQTLNSYASEKPKQRRRRKKTGQP
jgi:hypothetical protein